jgi:hypothetical protein
MTRPLPPAITAALAAPGATPTVAVTSEDLPRRLALLAATGAPAARTSVLVTASGAILRAAISQHADPNTLTIYRIVDITSPTQWAAAGTVITTNAAALAGCALVQTAGTIRCFWLDASALALVYADSTDDGQTWSAPSTALATPTLMTACTGIAAIASTDVLSAWYAYPQAGSLLLESVQTGGAWAAAVSVGPSSPRWGQLRGLCAQTSAGGLTVLLAGVQLRAQISGIAGAATTRTGSVWSPWKAIHDMDTPTNGLSNANPTLHHDPIDGYSYACIHLQDDGTVTGQVQNRVSVWRSLDGVSWSLVQAAGNLFSYETHWLNVAGASYLFDNQAVYHAPSPGGPSDLSVDLLALHISERADRSTTFTMVLANRDGQYNDHPALRDNAAVRIALGYNGVTIPTHTAYIDALEYRATPEGQTLHVHARDLTKFLDQICAKFTSLAGLTIGQLAAQIHTLANVPLAPLPATSQFAQVVPCFAIVPGESWYQALQRLGAIYDFQQIVTQDPSIALVERSAGDPSSWTYGQETLGIAWQQSADQPNIVRVVGAASGSTNVFAEAVDSANMLLSGAHRYRHIVDRMCDTAAKCSLKGALALRDDQTRAESGSLTVALNPTHEILDVITLTDPRLGLSNQPARITAITTQIDFTAGLYQQQLTLQLP